MNLMYQVILCLFVRTTLCQKYTDNEFSINVTKHITAVFGDCSNIPYEYTFPSKNVTLPYTEVWFNENEELKTKISSRFSKSKHLSLKQLPPGEHVFGLRLEWGHNETYTYPETVQVSVSALTKSPDLTVDNLIEGQPANLRCSAPLLCNRAMPEITWRGANVVPVSENFNRMRFSPQISTVKITPNADHHNTNITCQLHYRNTLITQKTVTLKVQYSPKVLNSSKCVRNENEIVCKCVSHGNPLPTLQYFIPSGFYHTKYTSNDSQTVEEIVHMLGHMLGSYNHNSTLICVSNNYLGSITKYFNVQNLTSIFPTNELNSNAVPWIITGVSLCLSLIMLIIVIFQCKQTHKKKHNEEVNMYASLKRTSMEQEYSVIFPQPQ